MFINQLTTISIEMTILYEPEISTAVITKLQPFITKSQPVFTKSQPVITNLKTKYRYFVLIFLKIYLWRSPERKHLFHCR